MLFIVCLSALFVTSMAQYQFPARCPYVTPMEKIDILKVLGSWYQIARIPNMYEFQHTCTFINLNLTNTNSIIFSGAAIGSLAGQTIQWRGTGVPIPGHPQSQAKVIFPTKAIQLDTVLSILDTDYKNYLVVYMCQNLDNHSYQYTWITSKQRTLSPEFYQHAKKVLQRNFIPTHTLEWVDQEGCDE